MADPAADRRVRLAPAVPGFDDVDALLASVELDLVVVATPPGMHETIAAAASAVGVPSLVEKPPAGDAAGAAALAALRPAPWIGFNRRFDPDVGRLRAMAIATRATQVDVELSIDPLRWASFEGSPNALVDLGPHAADLACWTTGRSPRRVRSRAPDGASSSFVLELDGQRRVSASRTGPAGARRCAWARDRRPSISAVAGIVERARRALARAPGPLVESLRAQLEAAGRAVRGEPADPRLASAAEGARVMAVLDAAARAEREPGSWVAVGS